MVQLYKEVPVEVRVTQFSKVKICNFDKQFLIGLVFAHFFSVLDVERVISYS